jgi:uncharacterized protein (DUF1330 family)
MSKPKGYWVVLYRSVKDASRLKEYAERAVPAITGGGGRFLARGAPAAAFESGAVERTVVIEFDSVTQAIETYNSAAYQAALRFLEGAAERDVRMIEGVPPVT